MAYQSWSVVFEEQPSVAKWNILGANDASFNDGTGIGTDAIRDSSLYYGKVRYRRGGTSGDGSWGTSGTTDTATDAKDVFIQVGAITPSSGTQAVSFPVSFTQVPLIFVTPQTANSFNTWARVKSVTTSGFEVAAFTDLSTSRTTETVGWLAVGQ